MAPLAVLVVLVAAVAAASIAPATAVTRTHYVEDVTAVVGQTCPEGYSRIEPEANQNVGGSYVYLCKKESLSPASLVVTGLDVRASGSKTTAQNCPANYDLVDVDLNDGISASSWVFLCVRREPFDTVGLKPVVAVDVVSVDELISYENLDGALYDQTDLNDGIKKEFLTSLLGLTSDWPLYLGWFLCNDDHFHPDEEQCDDIGQPTLCVRCNCVLGSASAASAASCTDCGAGAVAQLGASACTTCPPGRWANEETQACDECAAGRYSSQQGASDASACQPCATGRYAGAGASECLPCDVSASDAGIQCCTAGRWGNTATNECEACPQGTHSAASGAMDASTCVACPAGRWGSAPGLADCDECPAGTSSTAVGATEASTCVPCLVPTRSSAGAEKCEVCPAGTHLDDNECHECNAGTYSYPGSEHCSLCRAGTFSAAVRATSGATCRVCPPGTDTRGARGASECSLCDATGSKRQFDTGAAVYALWQGERRLSVGGANDWQPGVVVSRNSDGSYDVLFDCAPGGCKPPQQRLFPDHIKREEDEYVPWAAAGDKCPVASDPWGMEPEAVLDSSWDAEDTFPTAWSWGAPDTMASPANWARALPLFGELEGKFLLLGGRQGTWCCLHSTFVFDTRLNVYSAVAYTLAPRFMYSFAVYRRKAFIFGGMMHTSLSREAGRYESVHSGIRFAPPKMLVVDLERAAVLVDYDQGADLSAGGNDHLVDLIGHAAATVRGVPGYEDGAYMLLVGSTMEAIDLENDAVIGVPSAARAAVEARQWTLVTDAVSFGRDVFVYGASALLGTSTCDTSHICGQALFHASSILTQISTETWVITDIPVASGYVGLSPPASYGHTARLLTDQRTLVVWGGCDGDLPMANTICFKGRLAGDVVYTVDLQQVVNDGDAQWAQHPTVDSTGAPRSLEGRTGVASIADPDSGGMFVVGGATGGLSKMDPLRFVPQFDESDDAGDSGVEARGKVIHTAAAFEVSRSVPRPPANGDDVPARWSHAATVVDAKMVIMGGCGGAPVMTNDVSCLNSDFLVGGMELPTVNGLPTQHDVELVAAVTAKLSENRMLADTQVLDLKMNRWIPQSEITTPPDLQPLGLSHVRSVNAFIGGREQVLLIGGVEFVDVRAVPILGVPGSFPLPHIATRSKMQAFDPQTLTWSEVITSGTAGDRGPLTAVTRAAYGVASYAPFNDGRNTRVVVSGGLTIDIEPETLLENFLSVSLSSGDYPADHNAQTTFWMTSLSGMFGALNDAWVLDTDTLAWRQLSRLSRFVAFHTMLFIPSEPQFIMLGGASSRQADLLAEDAWLSSVMLVADAAVADPDSVADGDTWPLADGWDWKVVRDAHTMPEPMAGAIVPAVAVGSKVIRFGGTTTMETPLSDVVLFDVADLSTSVLSHDSTGQSLTLTSDSDNGDGGDDGASGECAVAEATRVGLHAKSGLGLSWVRWGNTFIAFGGILEDTGTGGFALLNKAYTFHGPPLVTRVSDHGDDKLCTIVEDYPCATPAFAVGHVTKSFVKSSGDNFIRPEIHIGQKEVLFTAGSDRNIAPLSAVHVRGTHVAPTDASAGGRTIAGCEVYCAGPCVAMRGVASPLKSHLDGLTLLPAGTLPRLQGSGPALDGWRVSTRGVSLTSTDLVIRNVVVANHVWDFGGGAGIRADLSTVNMTNVKLLGNVASAGVGGAVAATSSRLWITDSTVAGNVAVGTGGAVDLSVSTLEATGSEFSSNAVLQPSHSAFTLHGGGAIACFGKRNSDVQEVVLTGCDVSNNTVGMYDVGHEESVAAVRAAAGATSRVRLESLLLADTAASAWHVPDSVIAAAAAVDQDVADDDAASVSSPVWLVRGTSGVSVDSSGGGLLARICTVRASDTLLSGNVAGTGGALSFHSPQGTPSAVDGGSMLIANVAASGNGGAVSCEACDVLSVSDVRVDSNAASADGGGVYLQTVDGAAGTSCDFDRVTFAANFAARGGGLAETQLGTIGGQSSRTTVGGGTSFDGNAAAIAGGGLFFTTEEEPGIDRSSTTFGEVTHNAAAYGPDSASDTRTLRVDNADSIAAVLQVSGAPVAPSPAVVLSDFYNQDTVTDHSTLVTVRASTEGATTAGITQVVAVAGIAHFGDMEAYDPASPSPSPVGAGTAAPSDGLRVLAEPGSAVELTFSASIEGGRTLSAQALGVSMRGCGPGEARSSVSPICAPCEPGWFSLGDTPGVPADSCLPCEPGHFAALARASSCDTCPAGQFAPSPRATSCRPCSSVAGAVAAVNGSSSCTDCLPGTHRKSPDEPCKRCAVGSVQPLPRQETCVPCGPGEFANATGMTSCLRCGAGSISQSQVGSSGCDGCDKGSVPSVDRSSCVPCEGNTISEHDDDDKCTPCPPGRVRNIEGTQCDPCDPGFVPDGVRCKACPPGYTSDAFTGVCIECAAGEVPDRLGGRLDVCVPCGFGEVRRQGEPECTRCQPGTREAGNHTTCEPCAVGTVAQQRGSTECSRCANGTYSSEGGTECLPCGAAQVSDGVACADCADGEVPNFDGRRLDQCVPCKAGWARARGDALCALCPAGTSAEAGSTACLPCAEGLFASQEGSVACRPPDAGWIVSQRGSGAGDAGSESVEFGTDGAQVSGATDDMLGNGDNSTVAAGQAVLVGAQSQVACPAGRHAASATHCERCLPGHTSDAASIVCNRCPAGLYEDGDRLKCLPCPVGHASAADAATSCGRCEPGSFAAEPQSTSCLPCAPGSIAKLHGMSVCTECQEGTYADPTATRCVSCPSEGVECSRGILRILDGYWLPPTVTNALTMSSVSNNSGARFDASMEQLRYSAVIDEHTVFHRCPPGACGVDANNTMSCLGGRTGPLCAVCETSPPHYSVGSACLVCPSAGVNWALLVLMAIVLFGGASFMIYRANTAWKRGPAPMAGRPNAEMSTRRLQVAARDDSLFIPVVKIGVNWLQLSGLMNDFDVPWPAAVENLFAVSGSASTVPVSASFVTCTLDMSYYARFWLACSAPAIAAAALLVMPAYNKLVAGARKASGGRSSHWGRYRTAVLVAAYLLYPTTTREVVRMLDCSEDLGGTSYLKADFLVACGTPKHTFHVVVALIVMVVFCAGLPFGIFVLLERRRRQGRLHAASTRRRYMFLMDGYAPDKAWWESLVIARKFLVVTIAATLGGSEHNHQVYAGCLVVAVVLGLQMAARPYLDDRKARLELGSLLTSTVGLYAGLLFAIGGISDGVRVFVASLVIVLNAAFAFWLASVLFTAAARKLRLRGKPNMNGVGDTLALAQGSVRFARQANSGNSQMAARLDRDSDSGARNGVDRGVELASTLTSPRDAYAALGAVSPGSASSSAAPSPTANPLHARARRASLIERGAGRDETTRASAGASASAGVAGSKDKSPAKQSFINPMSPGTGSVRSFLASHRSGVGSGSGGASTQGAPGKRLPDSATSPRAPLPKHDDDPRVSFVNALAHRGSAARDNGGEQVHSTNPLTMVVDGDPILERRRRSIQARKASMTASARAAASAAGSTASPPSAAAAGAAFAASTGRRRHSRQSVVRALRSPAQKAAAARIKAKVQRGGSTTAARRAPATPSARSKSPPSGAAAPPPRQASPRPVPPPPAMPPPPPPPPTPAARTTEPTASADL